MPWFTYPASNLSSSFPFRMVESPFADIGIIGKSESGSDGIPDGEFTYLTVEHVQKNKGANETGKLFIKIFFGGGTTDFCVLINHLKFRPKKLLLMGQNLRVVCIQPSKKKRGFWITALSTESVFILKFSTRNQSSMTHSHKEIGPA